MYERRECVRMYIRNLWDKILDALDLALWEIMEEKKTESRTEYILSMNAG